jgi:RNA polymerase sigma factor (sigma-70 family)
LIQVRFLSGLPVKDSASLSFCIYKQHVFVSYSFKNQTIERVNELELIQGLRDNDEVAFKYLVDNYQDRVFNTAIGIVQNAEDAEDVAQEVFIQVFRSIHGFKGESKLSTWIYRITTTRALDLLRSRKSKKRFGFIQRLFGDGNEPLYEIPDFNHPGVAMDRKENAAKLFKAIAQLPENQKTAFTLHKLEDLSYQEISEVMKTSVPAVESLMHRAKQNLRKILEKEII